VIDPQHASFGFVKPRKERRLLNRFWTEIKVR
jgi:hypothetical protein